MSRGRDVDPARPLLIVEGPSDVAAALTVRLQAVGRPSARGGIILLAALLSAAECPIIVLGENDNVVLLPPFEGG